MKTLSKEIEEKEVKLTTAQSFPFVRLLRAERETLKVLRENYPYLDHPACFLVEEMVDLIERLSGAGECLLHSTKEELLDGFEKEAKDIWEKIEKEGE